MNVAESILLKGDAPDTALRYGNRSVTYRELREGASLLAINLLVRGHGPGDRIGLVSENSPFFVIGYLGVIQAGLVVVPLQAPRK